MTNPPDFVPMPIRLFHKKFEVDRPPLRGAPGARKVLKSRYKDQNENFFLGIKKHRFQSKILRRVMSLVMDQAPVTDHYHGNSQSVLLKL